ncbi:glycoside hydrolase, partial [Staphylotrichum tortipilum]
FHSYDPNTPPLEQLNQPWLTQRAWSTIDPVFTVSSPSLACNTPATAPPSYIPTPAGANLTAVYWYWLHPVGPMTVWLARCGTGDCRNENVNEIGWFKIWEAGLLEGPNLAEGLWYQKGFQRWDGSPALWPVRIPKGLKGGLYMVRHEILSIHVEEKPQFYPECAHLNVTGDGEVVVPEEWLVRFPGVYKEDDPSIKINIYSEENANRTDYVIPGGPIWEG